MKKRILVCGGRDFGHTPDDRTLFLDTMALHADSPEILIHGCARGADTLADQWASKHAVPVLRFPARWQDEGHAAGPIRNSCMLKLGRPDLVIAFPGGDGTADLVAKARRAGIRVVDVQPCPPRPAPPAP